MNSPVTVQGQMVDWSGECGGGGQWAGRVPNGIVKRWNRGGSAGKTGLLKQERESAAPERPGSSDSEEGGR